MRNIIAVLFILCISTSLFSQTQEDKIKEDSILQAIQLYKEQNKKLEASQSYLELVRVMTSFRNFEKVEQYIKAGTALLPDDAPNFLRGQYLHREAYLMLVKNDYDPAKKLFEQAIELLKDYGEYPLPYGELLMDYATYYSKLGDREKALKISLESLSIIEKTKMPEKTLPILYSIASKYRLIADYEQALIYTRKGIELSKKHQLFRDQGYFHNHMFTIFSERDEFEKGIKNLLIAIECFEKSDDKWMQHLLMGNLGSSIGREAVKSKDDKKIKEAEELFDKAYRFFQEIRDTTQMAFIFFYKGQLYQRQKKYDKAIEYFKKNISLLGTKSKDQISDSYQQIGHIYFENQQFDEAYSSATAALKYAKEINNNRHLINATLLLSNIEKERKNFESSLSYFNDYFIMYDSIRNEKSNAVLQKEKVTQDVEGAVESQKEAELKAELLSSRNTLYLTIAAALLGLLLLGLYLYQKLKKSRQEVEEQKIQLEQLNATKDKFFGIIAHDIRSPIVALDGVGNLMEHYVEKDDKPKLKRLATRVDNTAKQLGGLLDNLLNWALLQQGVIPYQPKALSIQNVVENTFAMFQNNAEAKEIKLVSEVDKNIQVHADEAALNTILRNLVSNAIKFTPKGGTVSVGTEVKDNKVFIVINDTGTGISAEQLKTLFTLDKKSEQGTAGEKGTGLGLNLVKELVELNKGILDVSSIINKGSQFSVGLPKV